MGSRLQNAVIAALTLAAALHAADPLPAPSKDQAPTAAPNPVALAGQPGRLLTQYLNHTTDILVGISPHEPTTIMFPAPGLGLQGIGFMSQGETDVQPVQIDHTPGTNFFTVRAITPDARAALNVLFEGRIYAFTFYLSPAPTRALTLLRPPAPTKKTAAASPRHERPIITVDRLIRILDEAKAYFVVQQSFPGFQSNISVQEKGYRISYSLFDVLVDHAWRFEREDTIVLRLVLLNKTPKPVFYRQDAIAVKIGERTFYASIVDADGIIPPAPDAEQLSAEVERTAAELTTLRKTPKHDMKRDRELTERLRSALAGYTRGQSVAYVAITGNADGSRANISLKNNFNVLITTGKAEGQ